MSFEPHDDGDFDWLEAVLVNFLLALIVGVFVVAIFMGIVE